MTVSGPMSFPIFQTSKIPSVDDEDIQRLIDLVPGADKYKKSPKTNKKRKLTEHILVKRPKSEVVDSHKSLSQIRE